MSVVHIDRIDTLEMEERPSAQPGGGGIIVGLKRRARVVELTGSDYRVLSEALDDVGLTIGSQPSASHPNLVLIHRAAALIPEEPDKVDVDLTYELRGMSLDSLSVSDFLVHGEVNLQQVSSQKDKAGNILSVSYRYPADYELDQSLQNKLISQVGEVNINVPMRSLRLRQRVIDNFPHQYAQERVGKINSLSWVGGARGSWIVNSAVYEPYDLASAVWQFEFELSHNPFGQNPDASYRDPRSGRPPTGLVVDPASPGTPAVPLVEKGLFEVDAHEFADFNALFPGVD